jgi:hypothetical protein
MADKTPPLKAPATRPTSQSVAAFLQQAAKVPMRAPDGKNGRLIFAMDATASRGPTWAQAMGIQTEMFQEAATVGGLDVQLVYYRGLMDFGASPWMSDAERVIGLMRGVDVVSGHTQIERVLRHATEEAKRGKVNAVVFIGDAVEESADLIAAAAGHLALRGVPVFIFHEGGAEPPRAGNARDYFDAGLSPAGSTVRQIAPITHGAYSVFDARSPQQLRDLLKAVAIFAAGGRKALENFSRKTGGVVLKLTHQIGGKSKS